MLADGTFLTQHVERSRDDPRAQIPPGVAEPLACPPVSRILRAVIEKGPAAVSEVPPPQGAVLPARAAFPGGAGCGGRRSLVR